MPDTTLDAFLNLHCNPLLFHDTSGAFVTIKSLFPSGRGNRAECGSDDFENLLNLVWE
jgi:hypothetical protein